MKIKIIALTLASLTYTLNGAVFTQKTTAIAADKGYPAFIVKLRNRATDFITGEKVRMMLEVDDLRQQDLDYRADELFEQNKKAYFALEQDVDSVFEKISRTFLTQAAELDRQNASAKKKAALIARTKRNALRTVTRKLQSYERIMKNNPRSVDN